MKNILEEANELVHGDRQNSYGHPLDNHSHTAEYWNVFLSRQKGPLTAEDVCWLNILQKISRARFRKKRDNLTDTAGYAENIEMIWEELERRFNLGHSPGKEEE